MQIIRTTSITQWQTVQRFPNINEHIPLPRYSVRTTLSQLGYLVLTDHRHGTHAHRVFSKCNPNRRARDTLCSHPYGSLPVERAAWMESIWPTSDSGSGGRSILNLKEPDGSSSKMTWPMSRRTVWRFTPIPPLSWTFQGYRERQGVLRQATTLGVLADIFMMTIVTWLVRIEQMQAELTELTVVA